MTLRKLFRCESGAAAVELGVVLPLLALLTLGVIEVGRYMYFGVVAAHAAEAGAQYGAQNVSDAQNQSAIQAAVAADSPNVTWTSVTAQALCFQNGALTACTGGVSTGLAPITYYVKVKVSGTFRALFSYPGVPSQIPVTSTTTTRVLVQ